MKKLLDSESKLSFFVLKMFKNCLTFVLFHVNIVSEQMR